ncbi:MULTISPECIES: carbon storage regulator CsrA [Tindallia]|uniref:Translational regulator CsrA n=2 Tax=Tindallia TaxID=69894 RepID=A0A1H3LC32_9FIRM|nr:MULTISPECIES: carbon storage regulator CsrA [Tindallia]SDY61951.1 carbon storage regulator, CsrA [Tindallia californiensis]SFH70164.1 carbon storage regulator, CsrA [Tindallia magadiensis]
MLVLTRKPEESIVLGNDIEIKILSLEEGKVKIGIKAPKHVEIHRKEVYLEIQKENKEAAGFKINAADLKKVMTKK